LIANDDTTFGSELLANARSYLAAHQGVMLQAVPVDPATEQVLDRGISIDWLRFRMGPAMPGAEIDCLATRCLFSRLADVMATGGFRRRFLPHYFSDYEFTIRAKRSGIRLATSDEVRIVVSHGTTGIRSVQSMTLRQYVLAAYSRRNTGNPFYSSIFVLLAAPVKYLPVCLVRIWGNHLLELFRSLRFSLRSSGSPVNLP
jgi:GT2 family glycosyltransferase